MAANKRKFLNSGWRYIYTLNYDDAIERNLDIETLFPYCKHSKNFIEQHPCLFKLHGDAKEFTCIYQNDKRSFNAHIKGYFMLDTLQTLFSNNETKGVLKLPNAIYEKLHNKLFNHYQFLHQEAKCELRVARRERKENVVLRILQKAFGNINRAMDLGMKSQAENIEYALNHMRVTKALILSNYLLIGKKSDKINETIKVYYKTFVEERYLLDDDFLKNDDLKDVNNFMNYVLVNCNNINLSLESKEHFGEIYYIRNGKHVRL